MYNPQQIEVVLRLNILSRQCVYTAWFHAWWRDLSNNQKNQEVHYKDEFPKFL